MKRRGNTKVKLEQIHKNLDWNIYIYDKKLSQSDEVSILPSALTITFMTDLKQVIDFVDACSVCTGNNDQNYAPLVNARKGNFIDITGMYIAI